MGNTHHTSVASHNVRSTAPLTLEMKVELRPKGPGGRVQLQEKVVSSTSCFTITHSPTCCRAYIDAAGIAEDRKAILFHTNPGSSRRSAQSEKLLSRFLLKI